jgi:hypothetical protein
MTTTHWKISIIVWLMSVHLHINSMLVGIWYAIGIYEVPFLFFFFKNQILTYSFNKLRLTWLISQILKLIII